VDDGSVQVPKKLAYAYGTIISKLVALVFIICMLFMISVSRCCRHASSIYLMDLEITQIIIIIMIILKLEFPAKID
jgi:hypothetical protein